MKHRSAREKNHPVRLFLDRVASVDVAEYPEWDLTVGAGGFGGMVGCVNVGSVGMVGVELRCSDIGCGMGV